MLHRPNDFEPPMLFFKIWPQSGDTDNFRNVYAKLNEDVAFVLPFYKLNVVDVYYFDPDPPTLWEDRPTLVSGINVLSILFSGDLSSRLSGAVSWYFHQKSGSARKIATAWNSNAQTQPVIEDSSFLEHASVSTIQGSAALLLNNFQANMEGVYKCNLMLSNSEAKEYSVRFQYSTICM